MDMGIPNEQLEARTNRELDCLLAKNLYDNSRYLQDEWLEVRGEYLCARPVAKGEKSPYRRPIPNFTTTWEGFEEAMKRRESSTLARFSAMR
jgi:hypothetical protein